MPRGKRRFTDEQEAEIRKRYQAGEGSNTLARVFACDTRTIAAALARQAVALRTEAEAQRVRGEQHGESYRHKLPPGAIAIILRRYCFGDAIAAIAHDHNITTGYVSQLANEAGLRRRKDRRNKKR